MMNNYKLFLDDVRFPEDCFRINIDPIYEKNENWIIVRDYCDFISYIKENGIPEFISFDHDLSYEAYLPHNQEGDIDYGSLKEKTGYHCALWLINYCKEKKLRFPNYMVHSMNKEGKKNIIKLIENFKK